MGYPEFYLSYRITKEINSGVKLNEDFKFSNRLSKFLSVLKKNENALEYYSKSLEIYKKSPLKDHPDISYIYMIT